MVDLFTGGKWIAGGRDGGLVAYSKTAKLESQSQTGSNPTQTRSSAVNGEQDVRHDSYLERSYNPP